MPMVMRDVDFVTTGLVRYPRINETNERINCLHPVIIVNPVFKDLIYKYRNYTFLGRYYKVSGSVARYWPHFPPHLFHPSQDMSSDELDSCFVTDFSTGEVFPIFIQVPCGHCEICRGSKIDSFAHRCELETQCYNHLPYFVTLTYRDQDLPPDGLRVKDAQDFVKRLRSRLDYAGFNDHFRYVLVGEYGSQTHRCHMHMLIWNLYPTRDMKFFKIRRLVHQSWSHGFTFLSIVSPAYKVRGHCHGLAKPEDCFRYVAKYICKDCFVPPGQNRPFVNTSRRNGGIGAPFIDRHARYIRKNRSIDFKYKDVFSGKVKSLVYCRYVLNRLFPTFCQSVPLELRNSVRWLCLTAPFVKGSSSYMDLLQEHFKSLFWPTISLVDCSPELHFSYSEVFNLPPPGACSIGLHELWKNISILLKYKDFDFSKSEELAQSRSYVVAKLFEHKQPIHLLPLASRRRRYRELAQQREFF